MRVSFVVFILGLAGCLAWNDVELEAHDAEDSDFQDKNIASESEEGPSFEEINREMEKQGVLRNPNVLGIFRDGEKPHNLKPEPQEEEPAVLQHQASHLFSRSPMCRRRRTGNYQITLGNTAFLVVYNFDCGRNRLCYWCSGRWLGYCRLKRIRLTMRICVQRGFRWYWTWRNFYIPSHCKCYSRQRQG
ncbi:uncharacterized protein LOC110235166 [Exaiptasia diaphana]|uniref:Uncharacterized protein n=1 Tax=Exaiptasia diaphana TaxID=2652724 RepID=A0A913WZA5_EXADI|nr:uncharacterized protein LOC110235166 [Exaiptasia diaphana]KXJ16671.1 hypothetical protein AC249_AIPGENE16131 [Exaiptasia diaphana]